MNIVFLNVDQSGRSTDLQLNTGNSFLLHNFMHCTDTLERC